MKCVCGYEEPSDKSEEVNIYFKSGPRKGELKCIDTVVTEVCREDKFIEIRVERGFAFMKVTPSYSYYDEWSVDLYACPKCGTIKMDNKD